jgi:hypothetical protein
MPAVLIHLYDPFDPTKRTVQTLSKPTTVRRLVSKHKALRRHTTVCRPGGVYGRRKVREFTRPTVCLLNGKALKRAEWKRATVGAGDVVAFWTPPAGGNGGGSNPLMIVAMVAIIIISVVLQQYYLPGAFASLTGAAATSTGVGIASTVTAAAFAAAASYGVMALFGSQPPQSMQSTSFGTGTQTSPTYSLVAQGNTARLEQPIPDIVGRHRIFPDFIGQPYIHYSGDNDQFLHFGLSIGIGEYEIDEDSIKIGDTPISTFDQIIYDIVPPGGVHVTAIWDTRWLPSNDLATVELPGAGADPPSPWKGPFIANPPNTLVDRVEVDFSASRGSFAFDPVTGGLDPKSWAADLEAREIDADGEPVGAGTWLTLGTFAETKRSQEPWRWTQEYIFDYAARWEVRIRRTDIEDESLQAGHQLDWIGLRGRLTSIRRFAGMTCLDIRMKASGDLNSVTSRRVNLIVTRKLPTWDDEAGAMTTEVTATRNPCDAFAYIARSSNGGRIPDDKIDLAGLYENYDFFDYEGWTFDFVFDQSITVSEGLARVARAVIAERVVQGSKLRLVRDTPTVAPVAMFGPRNIRQGSVELSYSMVDSTSADALICTYMHPKTWKPADLTIAFDDSAQDRPTRLPLHGITNREQAWAVGWWIARQNKYRRRVVKWGTEMEGLAVLFGDGISFSHDMPRWGQSMEVLGWDEDTRTLALSDPPDFSALGTHYVAIRDSTGMLTGPFEATAVMGQPTHIVVGAGTLPIIYTGGDQERTFVQFGPGEAYAKQLKVKQVTPRSEEEAEIIAFDDDPRMYDELPPLPAESQGGSQNPVVLHITAPAQNLNLRTLANANGYVGVPQQAVTITIDAGIEVTSVVRGTWPPDYDLLTLINLGTISGAGGAGGASGYGSATQGGAGNVGGTALDASTGAISVDNAAGLIRAGGGGGGGGAVSAGAPIPPSTATPLYGGGGGGGGQGNPGGAGGVALGSGLVGAGSNGTAGSTSAPGAGGAGAHWTDPDLSEHDAPSGGAGGTWGEEGEPGGAGFSAGGAPGAGGKAIKGNANVTWVGDQGTIIGAIAA